MILSKAGVRHRLALGLAFGMAAVSTAGATDAGTGIDERPYLFGDWDGNRTALSNRGIDLDFGYTSEVAHNSSGGTKQLSRYADQWKMGAAFDLGKLANWNGAMFRLLVTDRNGRELGADAHLGTSQEVQEIYGRGQTWHLTEMSLEQDLFNDRLHIKGGRLAIGGDFASVGCDFQNLSFCGAPPGNIAGDQWGSWPVSVWAIVLKGTVTEHSYVQLGGYQVNPSYFENHYARSKGLVPGFPGGTTGALIPFEFGWTPSSGDMPGVYKAGGWYNTSHTRDLYLDVNRQPLGETGGEALSHAGTYGGYVLLQQQFTGAPGRSGATAFLNITQTDRRTAATNGQIAMGVTYKAPFGRADDLMGIGVAGTHANARYAAYQRSYNSVHAGEPLRIKDGYEYANEVFYSWSPVPSLSLRPNVQYVIHPGGSSENSNAWVLGMRTTIAF